MTTVAPANLVVGGNLMVQLDVELPAWIGAQNDLTEVGRRVGRARYVGVRVQIQNRLSDGVDLGGRDLIGHTAIAELCS
jgi:hypothetical protein